MTREIDRRTQPLPRINASGPNIPPQIRAAAWTARFDGDLQAALIQAIENNSLMSLPQQPTPKNIVARERINVPINDVMLYVASGADGKDYLVDHDSFTRQERYISMDDVVAALHAPAP